MIDGLNNLEETEKEAIKNWESMTKQGKTSDGNQVLPPPPQDHTYCLQGCGLLIHKGEEHDYCSNCCHEDAPHEACNIHGEGTESYEKYKIWLDEQMEKKQMEKNKND